MYKYGKKPTMERHTLRTCMLMIYESKIILYSSVYNRYIYSYIHVYVVYVYRCSVKN